MAAGTPGSTPGTPGSPTDPAVTLYAALGRLVRDLRRAGGPSQIGPSAMAAMVTLSRADGGLRVGELAEIEGVSAPSITRIVRTLDELGLAVRTVDPRDGRCQVVTLTEAGEALIGSGRESSMQALRDRVAGLSEDHRRLLQAALPAFEALAAG